MFYLNNYCSKCKYLQGRFVSMRDCNNKNLKCNCSIEIGLNRSISDKLNYNSGRFLK